MANFSEKKVVVLLGGNVLNSGIVDYCKQHHFFVVVVDWSPNAYLKGDLFLCIDVKDTISIINALEEKGIHSIYGAYTSIDLAVSSVNSINKHYGLCSMDPEAIEHALPKAEMTRIWKENGILNRYSRVFKQFDDEIIEMSSKMKLILKPNISSSSRGITILEKGLQNQSVVDAFDKASKESFDHNVMVEEFIEGREFTCEMLGDANGNVSVYAISVKYHTTNTTNNKIAVKLHYNSDIYPDAVYENIANIGKACFKSLGFKSTFGHLEIIMKEDGTLSPIEIGARSSGFIANPLVSLASGQDFFGSYLNVLHGENVSGHDYINGTSSSMYFFYDMPHNTNVVNPCDLSDFLPIGVVSKYSNREKILHKGYEFNDITNDNERIGYEILTGKRSLMNINIINNAELKFIKKNIGQ